MHWVVFVGMLMVSPMAHFLWCGMVCSLPLFGVKTCEGLFRFGIFVIPAKAGIHFRRHPGEGRDPLSSVIPAKAGIHFDFGFVFRGSVALLRKPTHIPVSSFDIPVDPGKSKARHSCRRSEAERTHFV